MKKLILLALPLLMMVACTQEEVVVVTQQNEVSTEVNEYRLPLKDALKCAEILLSQIGDPATRSKTRKVASVEFSDKSGGLNIIG